MGTCSCLVLFEFICIFANMSILYHTVTYYPSQAYLIHKRAISINDMSFPPYMLIWSRGDGVSGTYPGVSGPPESPGCDPICPRGSFKIHT
jgi:hypothetical protein